MRRRQVLALLGAGPLAGCSTLRSRVVTTPTPRVVTRTVYVTREAPEPTATSSPTPDPAAFEVVGIDAPSNASLGDAYELSVTVRNTGGKPGFFRRGLYTRTDANTTWGRTDRIGLRLAPGEAKTWTVTLTEEYVGNRSFRVGEDGPSAALRIEPRRVGYGVFHTTPAGFAVNARPADFTSAYTYRDRNRTIREPAPDGEWWAFVTVGVRNEAETEVTAPPRGAFTFVAGDRTFTPTDLKKEEGRYEPGTVGSGSVRQGWIPYLVPKSIEKSAFRVVFSTAQNGRPVRVRWAPLA